MLEKLNKIPLKVPTLPLSNFQIHTTHTNICVHTYTQTYILGIVVRLLTNKLLKLRRMCMAISQLQTKIIFFLLKRQTDLKTKEVSTDITPFWFWSAGQGINRCGWEKKRKRRQLLFHLQCCMYLPLMLSQFCCQLYYEYFQKRVNTKIFLCQSLFSQENTLWNLFTRHLEHMQENISRYTIYILCCNWSESLSK